MRKTNKKKIIISIITILLITIILSIIIIRNVVKNSSINQESYLGTANANSTLVASYIKSGVTIGGVTGTLEILDPSDATATEPDVLAGETFYAGSNYKKYGSMTNYGSWSTTVEPGGSVYIPQGYHNGSGRVTASSGGGTIKLVDSYSTSRETELNYSKTLNDDSKAVIALVAGFDNSQRKLPSPTISSGTLSVSDFRFFDASSNNTWQYPVRVYLVNNIQIPFTINITSGSDWTWGWGVALYTVN